MPVVIVPGGGTDFGDLNIVRMHAEDLKSSGLAGIALRVRGKQQPGNSPNCWALVREMGCEGTGLRETYIKATGTDPPAAAQDYYLAKINARLSGRTRAIVADIGQGSEGTARTHARRLLQAVVDNGVEREYEIASDMPTALPALGDTVTVDDYTGVVTSMTWAASGEAESMVIRLIDYNATVLQ